jgi:hypothetical protein
MQIDLYDLQPKKKVSTLIDTKAYQRVGTGDSYTFDATEN